MEICGYSRGKGKRAVKGKDRRDRQVKSLAGAAHLFKENASVQR